MTAPLPVVRCGSCGQRATTTIILHGFEVPVCLRHLNVWKTPDFDADAAMLAEARAEVGRAVREWAMKNEIDKPPLDWAWLGEIIRWSGASLADPEATP